MKIKITENQYSRIRLVLEQDDYMKTYKNFCNQKMEEVNKIYSKLVNTSIAEIISGEVNIEQIKELVDKIESSVYNAAKNMRKLWDNQVIGADDENFDLVISEIEDSVLDKINPLSVVLYSLEKVQEESGALGSQFKDVKPIEVQSF